MRHRISLTLLLLLILCQEIRSKLERGQQNVIGRICTLPKERGLCRANIPRWYHNPKTSRCEKFFYGGCNGNGNNFFKKELCEKACNNT
uniref:Serine peptidase inhibitor, Kunitz type 3 n=1 Tax=Rousettus aegyptiacus TaxID=9407 RepID=A0A7J8DLW8_ROUAE|nr:serine peptidase inhibitor, Kunitz type 3 [Rousettus aegyptiacus]